MNESASVPRSIGAVIAGMVTVIVLSTLTDLAMHKSGVFPPEGQPMSNQLWCLATAYRIVFGAVGGFVTAKLAPGRPLLHATILGFIGLALSTLGVLATWGKGPEFGPKWYPIGLVITALPSTLLGGWLGRKRG